MIRVKRKGSELAKAGKRADAFWTTEFIFSVQPPPAPLHPTPTQYRVQLNANKHLKRGYLAEVLPFVFC